MTGTIVYAVSFTSSDFEQCANCCDSDLHSVPSRVAITDSPVRQCLKIRLITRIAGYRKMASDSDATLLTIVMTAVEFIFTAQSMMSINLQPINE